MDKSILSKRHGDCFACRLISGGGLMGMGYYVWYHSKSRTSKLGRYSMIGIATVTGLIGTSRLFNIYPFNTNKQNNDFYIRKDSSVK